MSKKYIFADEAGCFTFNREPNVSRFFILCTIMMDDRSVGDRMLALRRELAWSGAPLGEYFHATSDRQSIRDEVYAAILDYDFTVQATIMEKSKAQPHIRATKAGFYEYACFYHFKHGIAGELTGRSEALVTTASLGQRRERAAFQTSVENVMRQTQGKIQTDFMPAHANPCLQVADYCAWAIQRKWERGDLRSYELIRSRLTYEYELWRHGERHFY